MIALNDTTLAFVFSKVYVSQQDVQISLKEGAYNTSIQNKHKVKP